VHAPREERESRGPEYDPSAGVEIAGRKFSYDIQAIRAERARRKFSHFVRDAWEHLPLLADTKLEWGWHHDAMCDHLQAMAEDWAEARTQAEQADAIQRIRNLLINIAPGSTKTLIVMVFFPCRMWTRYPRWGARCVSSNPRAILESASNARILIQSEWYRRSFIPQTGREPWARKLKIVPWRLREDQNAESEWGNSMGGFRR